MANIILIHGMWSHHQVAAPLRRHLENVGHCVFAPELPAHDRRDPDQAKKVARLSTNDYVTFLTDLIEKEEFSEPPVLIGHSMGGLLAQMVASRIDVAGLCLLNSAAPAGTNHIYPSPSWFFRRTLGRFRFWAKPHKPSLQEARWGLMNRTDFDVARDFDITRDYDIASAVHETLVAESGRAFFELVFWWLDLRRTTRIELPNVPTFIVSSGMDRVVHPRVARSLQKRYPHAEFQSFPENGHWIFHEAGAERIYEAIEIWLSASFGTPGSWINEWHHSPGGISESDSPSQLSAQHMAEHQSARDNSRPVRGNPDKNTEADNRSPISQ